MSPDLTIDSALSDPMIHAMMRADHVEPKSFERLLRAAATTVGDAAPRRALAAPPFVPNLPPAFSRGFCCA